MSFTDEELNRLKRDIEIGGVEWRASFFTPLLDRLEAAERVCEAASEKIGLHNKHCSARHKCALPRVGEALVGWLKAAGKMEGL